MIKRRAKNASIQFHKANPSGEMILGSLLKKEFGLKDDSLSRETVMVSRIIKGSQ